MASVSISHMILFIASMLIAASVAGVFTTSVDRLSGAIDDQGLQVSDDVRTDVEVISDNGTGACVYNCDGNGNLTLLVKNTGSRQLSAQPDQIDVLIDGQFTPASDKTVTVLGESDTWDRGAVVRVNVSAPGLSSGDHRAKVIVNGDEEVFEFRT
ncbi:flagellar protein G [Salinibaculum salinum]|uniref:flagellar protein G n=1 Tax=Salinibaculum salinum TaxID=3131996 RepID=UPI0030EF8555